MKLLAVLLIAFFTASSSGQEITYEVNSDKTWITPYAKHHATELTIRFNPNISELSRVSQLELVRKTRKDDSVRDMEIIGDGNVVSGVRMIIWDADPVKYTAKITSSLKKLGIKLKLLVKH